MGAGEEGIDFLRMGIALVFFTAILGYIVFNTQFGKQILNESIDRVETGNYNATKQSFEQFSGSGHVVKSAEAYAFIGYNENNIKSITCYVHNASGVVATGMDDTCLKTHLQGNVRMTADYDASEDQYAICLFPAGN